MILKYILLLTVPALIAMSYDALNQRHTLETARFNKTTALKKDAKKLAQYYRQRVMRGENMASIAKLYS